VKTIVGLFAAAALVGLATSAAAQPAGSYRDSCRDIRMQGSVLTALCRRAGGRGEQRSALNVEHCVGDIGNNNGNLVCNGGQPVSPPPSAGYPSGPGYPAQGYGPQPGSGYPPGQGYPAQGYGPPPGLGYPSGPGYPAQGYGPPPR
jgi:CVNH domain